MPGGKFAYVSLIAAAMLAGIVPISANERARHPATHSIRLAESRKAASAQIRTEADSQERATTAQLNSAQISPQESQLNRGPIVSVGPQARAFQRIRDIAMAPTG